MAKAPKEQAVKTTTPITTAAVEETVLEAGTQEQAPEITEVVEPVETVEDPMTEDPVAAVEETTKTLATNLITDIVYELERYQGTMAPRQGHQLSEGIIAQVSLYNTIKLVIQSTGDRFKQGMDYLVNWFSLQSAGCTNARYLFRYIATIPLSPSARTEFTRLLNLFTVAGEMKNNLSIVSRSVDVVASIADRDQATQARLLEYFKVN